ncbi:hypothetical protein FHG87_010575 [Trinorchestia longiramus]|nr:hypothetical protein FHG87_010575 [Trinorchestia longiramus]
MQDCEELDKAAGHRPCQDSAGAVLAIQQRPLHLLHSTTDVILHHLYRHHNFAALCIGLFLLQLPFDDLKAAMASPSWKIGLLAGTSLLDILRSSEGSQYEELYATSHRTPSVFVRSDEEGVARLLSEQNFAYFCESSSVSYLMRGNCSIMKVSGDHLSRYQHFGFSKHLPFADVLNAELTKLMMGGVMENLKIRWWGQLPSCTLHAPYTELDFSNIVTAYMLLAVGTVLAAFAFFAEIFSNKCKPRRPHSTLNSVSSDKPNPTNGFATNREENGIEIHRSPRNNISKNAYNVSLISVQHFVDANLPLDGTVQKIITRPDVAEGHPNIANDSKEGIYKTTGNRKRNERYGKCLKMSNSFCNKEHMKAQRQHHRPFRVPHHLTVPPVDHTPKHAAQYRLSHETWCRIQATVTRLGVKYRLRLRDLVSNSGYGYKTCCQIQVTITQLADQFRNIPYSLIGKPNLHYKLNKVGSHKEANSAGYALLKATKPTTNSLPGNAGCVISRRDLRWHLPRSLISVLVCLQTTTGNLLACGASVSADHNW